MAPWSPWWGPVQTKAEKARLRPTKKSLLFVSRWLSLQLADFGLAARVAPPGGLGPGAGLSSGPPPHCEGVTEAAPLDRSALESIFSAPELDRDVYGSGVDVYSAALTLAAAWAALPALEVCIRNDVVARQARACSSQLDLG